MVLDNWRRDIIFSNQISEGAIIKQTKMEPIILLILIQGGSYIIWGLAMYLLYLTTKKEQKE